MGSKTTRYIIYGILFLNLVAIIACVKMGLSFEDVSFLFQEREAITFLSALQLGFMSVLSVCIYAVKRSLHKENKNYLKLLKVWLISFILFAFATADEFFMIHEGIDGDIATFFFGMRENLHLDGITLALYGFVALFLFFKFKTEILKYKDAVKLFVIGGFFYLLSMALDLGSIDQFQIILEESSKLISIGFLFSGFVAIFSSVIKELDSTIY